MAPVTERRGAEALSTPSTGDVRRSREEERVESEKAANSAGEHEQEPKWQNWWSWNSERQKLKKEKEKSAANKNRKRKRTREAGCNVPYLCETCGRILGTDVLAGWFAKNKMKALTAGQREKRGRIPVGSRLTRPGHLGKQQHTTSLSTHIKVQIQIQVQAGSLRTTSLGDKVQKQTQDEERAEIHVEGKDARRDNEAAKRTEDARQRGLVRRSGQSRFGKVRQ
ncbi:hypothetical protein MRX96_055409 [Rhipicephalus microplus]